MGLHTVSNEKSSDEQPDRVYDVLYPVTRMSIAYKTAIAFTVCVFCFFGAYANAETLVLSNHKAGMPATVEIPNALQVLVTAKQIRYLDDTKDRARQVALLSGGVTIKISSIGEPVTIKADEVELTRTDASDTSAAPSANDNVLAQSTRFESPGVIVFSGSVAIVKSTTAGPIQIKADEVIRKDARKA